MYSTHTQTVWHVLIIKISTSQRPLPVLSDSLSAPPPHRCWPPPQGFCLHLQLPAWPPESFALLQRLPVQTPEGFCVCMQLSAQPSAAFTTPVCLLILWVIQVSYLNTAGVLGRPRLSCLLRLHAVIWIVLSCLLSLQVGCQEISCLPTKPSGSNRLLHPSHLSSLPQTCPAKRPVLSAPALGCSVDASGPPTCVGSSADLQSVC